MIEDHADSTVHVHLAVLAEEGSVMASLLDDATAASAVTARMDDIFGGVYVSCNPAWILAFRVSNNFLIHSKSLEANSI